MPPSICDSDIYRFLPLLSVTLLYPFCRRDTMNVSRCSHLDQLGRELIDAYRSLDGHEIFFLSVGDESAQDPVRRIHKLMAEHRQSCAICLQPHAASAKP
jgi:hypothetical protein